MWRGDRVTRDDVVRAIGERRPAGTRAVLRRPWLRPDHDLRPDLATNALTCPKPSWAAAYEFAAGQRLDPGDFEGGKSGAVTVLEKLGFAVRHKHQPAPTMEPIITGHEVFTPPHPSPRQLSISPA